MYSLFFIALLLRLFRLGYKSMWDDEGAALAMLRLPMNQLMDFMFSHDPHGPIYILLPKVLGITWKSSEFMIRLPHAVLGALAVPLCYAVLRRIYSSSSSFVAAVLMTFSPLYIQISQEYRLYTILMCIFLVSTWLLFKWLLSEINCRFFMPLYMLCVIAGLYTDSLPFLGFLLFHWFCGLYFEIKRKRFLLLLFLQAISCFTFLPFAFYYLVGSTHAGFEIHMSSQSSRIFASPLDQAMMFTDSAIRALHALFSPTTDYLGVLIAMLGDEKRPVAWVLFSAGAILLCGFLSRTGKKEPNQPLTILWPLVSVLILLMGIVGLSSLTPQKPQFIIGFLLPLSFIIIMLTVPFFTTVLSDKKKLILSTIIAVPVLYGAKALVPLDPRHFAIPFIFLLGHAGDSFRILWRSTMGRLVVAVLFLSIATSLLTYYQSEVQIFHIQNYRAASKAIAEINREAHEKVFINAGWGGQGCLHYYLDKEKNISSKNFWFAERLMDEEDPELPAMLEKKIGFNERAHVLTVFRMDESYYSFIAEMQKQFDISLRFFGQEVVLVTFQRHK